MRSIARFTVLLAALVSILGAAAAAAGPGAAAPVQNAPKTRVLTAEIQDDMIIVRIDEVTFTCYRYGAGLKLPYFYPVNGPLSGLSLTTETSLPYPHHRSLWFGCDRVNGGNYWQEGNDRGQIVSRGPKVVRDGPDAVRIADVCDWRQPGQAPIITDTREIVITAPTDALRIIDFTVTLKALTDIKIEKTNHSLFSARVVPALAVTAGGALVNAEGLTGEKATAGISSPWMDFSGTRFGLTEGLAIFDAPGNLWYPAKWFTRDYGFFSPTNMNWVDEAGVKLKSGETLAFRYRVIVHAGTATQAGVPVLFAAWEKERKGALSGLTGEVKLITLDPGHFHASLVQKTMIPGISPVVHVYAPEGPELRDHLRRIGIFNGREGDATRWDERIFAGPDFLERMVRERKGNVVVIAGSNARKMAYIEAAVGAGLNVLADKPMAVTPEDYGRLRTAFAAARRNGVLLYDIMTERSEITTLLQRELIAVPGVIGAIEKGTADDPSVIKASVHHFYKVVSGSPLIRPAWFFDTAQQGEGIVDVTTHLVDLIQWECFPGEAIDGPSDIVLTGARRWTTDVTRDQFAKATGLAGFSDYLRLRVRDGVLRVSSNGQIDYTLRGIHARVSVAWAFEPPAGGGDTHFSVIRGTRASVIIRQDKEQAFVPELYVEPARGVPLAELGTELKRALPFLIRKYPGLTLAEEKGRWRVIIPAAYRIGHEAHFAQVTERFLQYLKEGKLPDWEEPGMLAKYYLTTQALAWAR